MMKINQITSVISCFLLFSLLSQPSQSHESPDPIPITCGLKYRLHHKMFGPEMMRPMVYVTFAIPTTLIKEHFSVTEPFTIPYNIEIDTGEQIVKRSGEVPINIEDGVISVLNTTNPVDFPPKINGVFISPIIFEFNSVENYEKSQFYNVLSCNLY